ncbi:ATP-grasp domain-containing protein [Hallerella porci]|uniref:Biotin carboxylase n=1 Tax=Hallerella porci TaxID=1945871 RepID=A0ABX5LI72_9BACT|nr:ATP-grasp domain-containing protein [Hallerella porci]PWK93148.1 biotin carboxylase [Hallerella porci]
MKLAIIGAALGQVQLCKKAREMHIETIGFAWEKGAICKSLFDKFYPISIYETDKIIEICKKEKIDGVVTNASEKAIDIVAIVADALGLRGGPYETIKNIKDKTYTRLVSNKVPGFTPIPFYKYDGRKNEIYPCVIKPCTAAGKRGVSFVRCEADFEKALVYANAETKNGVTIEGFAEGQEISVESISFDENHYVIQITDKENSGAPHFVELGHHQPSALPQNIQNRIREAIPKLLDAVQFKNGATHIEIKIGNQGEIYLIEINPRGGGDGISNNLVEMSTNCDYVKKMIEVALGTFTPPVVKNTNHAGIYFLCKQTEQYINAFKALKNQPWLVEKNISSFNLSEATGNKNRNGYFFYCSDKKILLDEIH